MSRKKTTLFADFKPNVTPRKMFEYGVFGGTYWRPIDSGISGKKLSNEHKKFIYFDRISEDKLTSIRCDVSKNYFGKRSGQSLKVWESKGWITKHDPYGWVQWYCNYRKGRRIPGEDERQIKRWLNAAGPNGRWRRRYENNPTPTVAQLLLQWGYLVPDHKSMTKTKPTKTQKKTKDK